MSKILNLYQHLLESNQRFVDEVFEEDTYEQALQLTIIDIGAYEGEYSFYMYNVAKDIYAFEPDTKPYPILEKRVKDFNLTKIKCYPMAVANGKGTRYFHNIGGGGSRIITKEEVKSYTEDKVIEVETISLAQFVKENNINHIDILKIDIEGGEDEVFKSDDFHEIVGIIDVIIGEHLASVDGLLLSYGFNKTTDRHNAIYKR